MTIRFCSLIFVFTRVLGYLILGYIGKYMHGWFTACIASTCLTPNRFYRKRLRFFRCTDDASFSFGYPIAFADYLCICVIVIFFSSSFQNLCYNTTHLFPPGRKKKKKGAICCLSHVIFSCTSWCIALIVLLLGDNPWSRGDLISCRDVHGLEPLTFGLGKNKPNPKPYIIDQLNPIMSWVNRVGFFLFFYF